ncbi:MAG: thrombospondin type 3 repeat-containing protein [Patescibacteria group bacterium]
MKIYIQKNIQQQPFQSNQAILKSLGYLCLLIALTLCHAPSLNAQNNLSQKLSGRILLQVQSKGEAWYINPADQKRYSLGKPSNAWTIMRELSIGITNTDLTKIPVGIININTNALDNDQDGLSNDMEIALNTNPNNPDSDQDGYTDLVELNNNYNPINTNRLPIDINFTKKNLGKIFLQIESKGEAWYINPADQKRYFLNKPDSAFIIMKKLSLGITNENLNQILINELTTPIEDKIPEPEPEPKPIDDLNILEQAAIAIRSNDKIKAKSLFHPSMEKMIEYTLNYLNSESKLILANILSGSKLIDSTDDQKIYSTTVYFSMSGHAVSVKFYVKKQADNNWLLTNL